LKIYIVCDIEGVAGVVDFKEQCCEDGKYYAQAIKMATQELNAVVEGAIDGGATEVYAWPGHGNFPGGIDVELLHPECKLVMHASDGGPTGFNGTFDAMFLCGLHAMAGSEKGVLSHSFTPFIKNVWLNDARIGEIGINMAAFADLGIPAIFISGDEEAVWEARGLVPRIQGAVVKWGLEEKFRLGALTVRKATSLSPRKSCDLIRENAKTAMRKVGEIKPPMFNKPYYLRVEYIEPQYADQAAQASGVDRIDAFTTLQVREKTSDFAF
jgi:D-amino peptidase